MILVKELKTKSYYMDIERFCSDVQQVNHDNTVIVFKVQLLRKSCHPQIDHELYLESSLKIILLGIPFMSNMLIQHQGMLIVMNPLFFPGSSYS